MRSILTTIAIVLATALAAVLELIFDPSGLGHVAVFGASMLVVIPAALLARLLPEEQ